MVTVWFWKRCIRATFRVWDWDGAEGSGYAFLFNIGDFSYHVHIKLTPKL